MSKLQNIARIAANKINAVRQDWLELNLPVEHVVERTFWEGMIIEVAYKAGVSYRRAKWAIEAYL